MRLNLSTLPSLLFSLFAIFVILSTTLKGDVHLASIDGYAEGTEGYEAYQGQLERNPQNDYIKSKLITQDTVTILTFTAPLFLDFLLFFLLIYWSLYLDTIVKIYGVVLKGSGFKMLTTQLSLAAKFDKETEEGQRKLIGKAKDPLPSVLSLILIYLFFVGFYGVGIWIALSEHYGPALSWPIGIMLLAYTSHFYGVYLRFKDDILEGIRLVRGMLRKYAIIFVSLMILLQALLYSVGLDDFLGSIIFAILLSLVYAVSAYYDLK